MESTSRLTFIIPHSSLLLSLLLKQRLEVAVDRGGDDLRALRVRVNAVFLIQFVAPGDAFEEEGNEHDAVLTRERLEGFVNLRLVFAPRVRRRVHPCEEDLRAARLCALDYLRQVLFSLLDGLPAQEVVRAQLDDDEAHVA